MVLIFIDYYGNKIVKIVLNSSVTEDGPPTWVNFGKKIVTNLNQQGFKSLENRTKESKENVEFQTQRQDAISEATTQGAIKKVFGGGVKQPITFSSNTSDKFINNVNNQNPNIRASNKQLRTKQPKEKPVLEKQEKPSQKVSLFDFLEDKLPANEHASKLYVDEPKSVETNRFSKPQNKYDNSSKSGPSNVYQPNRDKQNYDYRQTNRNEQRPKYSNERNDSRAQQFQNEKPPRFQKQKPDNSYKFHNSAPENAKYSTKEYSKPDTNNFINKLASEINSISLYNSKYDEKLNRSQQNHMIPQQNHLQQNSQVSQQNSIWKWKTGDRCMAKYWEDNKVCIYKKNYTSVFKFLYV